MSLSDCVPFPTPGAPTSIILAAFFSFFDTVEKVIAANGSRRPTAESQQLDRGRKCPRQVKCPLRWLALMRRVR